MADTPYEKLDTAYFEMPIPNTEEFQVIRLLNKQGLARLWSRCKDKFLGRPKNSGSAGQALLWDGDGTKWGDVATDLPDVIPIKQGGTGCTTIDGIRTMLFNFPTDEEVEEYLKQGE